MSEILCRDTEKNPTLHGVRRVVEEGRMAAKEKAPTALLGLCGVNLLSACYLRSMNGTELPSMYCGILPSHFCTAS